MFKTILFLILVFNLYAVPPSPEIKRDVRDGLWPPAFSIVFTEPAGRNLVPGQIYFPGAQEKILVIIVEFSDSKTSDYSGYVNTHYGSGFNQDYFAKLVFGGPFVDLSTSITFSNKYNSMKRYYNEISYNQCSLIGNVAQVTLAQTKAYYAEDSANEVDNNNTKYYQIVKDAVQAVYNQGVVNLNDYDFDQDGYIDHPLIMAAARNQAANSQTPANKNSMIWPKRVLFTSYPLTVGSKKVAWGAICTLETPLGVVAHEFFHDLGASDLYDPDSGSYGTDDNNNYPVSYWGLMGAGGPWAYKDGQSQGECPTHPLGFHKWKMGWMDVETIAQSKAVNVYAIEKYKNNALYKVEVYNTGGSEYFLIENRNNDLSDIYYDKMYNAGFPMDNGLIITHVDESLITLYEGNYYVINWGTPDYNHYAVSVEDTQPFYNSIYDERKIYAAFSLEDLQTELTPYTSYGSTASYRFAQDSQIYISDISASGAVMTAKVSISPQPDNKKILSLIGYPSPLHQDTLNVLLRTSVGFQKGTFQLLSVSRELLLEKSITAVVDENTYQFHIPKSVGNGVYFIQAIGYIDDDQIISKMNKLMILRK